MYGGMYGLMGSIMFSKTSSNLAVYCLTWSRGLAYVGCEALGGCILVFGYGWFVLGNCALCCVRNMFGATVVGMDLMSWSNTQMWHRLSQAPVKLTILCLE